MARDTIKEADLVIKFPTGPCKDAILGCDATLDKPLDGGGHTSDALEGK